MEFVMKWSFVVTTGEKKWKERSFIILSCHETCFAGKWEGITFVHT